MTCRPDGVAHATRTSPDAGGLTALITTPPASWVWPTASVRHAPRGARHWILARWAVPLAAGRSIAHTPTVPPRTKCGSGMKIGSA